LAVAFDRGEETSAPLGRDRLASGPALAVRRTAMAVGPEEFVGLATSGLKTPRRPATGAAGEMVGAFAETQIARLATAIILRLAREFYCNSGLRPMAYGVTGIRRALPECLAV
jgi:hypothetical protein